MDEGLPISYQMLEEGVPVLAADEQEVGRVASVLSAPEKDIFHGLLIETKDHGIRFVPAEDVASIHEFGVDLRIDAEEAHRLPPPEHQAPVFADDPGESTWGHWVRRITLRGDWHREG
jgi:hypothetical protein